MKDLAVLLKACNSGHLLSANLHICIVLSAYQHAEGLTQITRVGFSRSHLAFIKMRFVFLSFPEQCKTQIWNMCVQEKDRERERERYTPICD